MLRTVLTTLLLVAAIGSAQGQTRVIRLLETSYELALGDIIFPSGATGSVIVKPCIDCQSATHRLRPTTIYLLNSTPVPFNEFLLAVEDRRRAAGNPTSVGVYLDIESKEVNRILLSYAN